MADTLRFTILGCGSSPGVPRISGDWGACDPHNPRNRRTRASALVERIGANGITRVVIDTGPDFREQMVRAGADTLDGAVYTHPHADHIHGIDDLRGYVITQRRLMDIWADDATTDRLLEAFGYCFHTPAGSSYPPILRRHPIRHYDAFTINGAGGSITFEPLVQKHGDIHSLAFRIGPLAYCSDVSAFPEKTLERLQNLDLLIVDALQYKRHPSHFSLGEALDWIDHLKPLHAVLTHMHVPLDYATVMAETPHNVEPAHDGLVLEFPVADDADSGGLE
ncbi:MAG: MBL fold metallo-hydrolase [Zhengella sp.]|uniref:MBL fold metallo-hydrolase n=1 Tax=Zhengella sp. TaxID=2282762 RepID=UPI001DA1AC59|nr:MBL fold metallo-hydrolase [Notoacmeibacter sp.]MCC0028479.1 MBL fold metallo-hydrolase [Brucellaceae bacterium]